MTSRSSNRRNDILQALAGMLEQHPGARITTAALAREVGVSEAALYRHFPSKARMFEGLIEFIEETLFSRLPVIRQEEPQRLRQCSAVLRLLLNFAERNPGFTRLLTGEALTGETDRLRGRVRQLFDRLETELRQTLRDAELHEGVQFTVATPVAANLLLAVAEGRLAQFARSEFRRPPTADWEHQWRLLETSIAVSGAGAAAVAAS